MNGAATNPDFRILARAAVQIRAMLEVNVQLGGGELRILGRPRRL